MRRAAREIQSQTAPSITCVGGHELRKSKYSTGLEGLRFNRTVIQSFSHAVKTKEEIRYYWHFLCDCGTRHVSDARSAYRKMVQSCGCLNRDPLAKFVKHGHARRGVATPEFTSWKKMKARCYNPRNEWFHRYGGRGIQVCQSLRDSFVAFLALLGPRPAGKTVDRIDNNGHYSCGTCSECFSNNWPMNVRWATVDEQNSNKSSTRLITFHGRTQALFLWAKEFGLAPWKLRERLKRESTDEAFTALSGSRSPSADSQSCSHPVSQ